jgi:hypothetical protein
MEEHRLKMFENGMLRKAFGPKRGEVTGGWKNLSNEELHKLYTLPSIIISPIFLTRPFILAWPNGDIPTTRGSSV